jgi:hypothetical protein
VGTGYFDMVTQVIAGGNSSTTALAGSTEAEQFTAGKPPVDSGTDFAATEYASPPPPERAKPRMRV